MNDKIVDLNETRRRKKIDELIEAAKHYRFSGIDLRVAGIQTHITAFGKSGDRAENDTARFLFYDVSNPDKSPLFGAFEVTREQLKKMGKLGDTLLDFRDEAGNIL